MSHVFKGLKDLLVIKIVKLYFFEEIKLFKIGNN